MGIAGAQSQVTSPACGEVAARQARADADLIVIEGYDGPQP